MSDRPYLTTAEAAWYLRYRTAAGVRTAVMRGELVPDGVGPRGTLLFRKETLDCFVQKRASSRVRRLARSAEVFDEADASQRHRGTGDEQIRDPGPRGRSAVGSEKGGATRTELHAQGSHRAPASVDRGASRGRRAAGADAPGGLRALVARWTARQESA